MMKMVKKNDKIKLVFTDSGLGGLGIMAETARYFFNQKPLKEIILIYFNSSPGNNKGYNKMETEKEKVSVFNNALNAIDKMYNPDYIFIACNTLSVIYDKTPFSKNSDVSVEGIVNSGLSVMLEKLGNVPDSKLIILGTPTTILTDTYRKNLIAVGIDGERIINQSCPNLESEIQINPNSDIVRMLINKYLSEATNTFKIKNEKILIALCCTHYGFSKNIFYYEMKNLGFDNFEIINPNLRMVELIKQKFINPRNEFIKINIEVISKAKVSEDEIYLIGEQVEKISPHLAEALRNYKLVEDLF